MIRAFLRDTRGETVTNHLGFALTWFCIFFTFLMNVQLGQLFHRRDVVDHAAAVAADTAKKTYCMKEENTSATEAEAKRAIARLRLPEDEVRTRRFQRSTRRLTVDPRATMRQSMRTGGALILPRYREPKVVHPPLVVLADISGSMSQYTRIFLHFLHALTDRRRRVHTFLFGTRLTNVTRQMRHRDPDEAVEQCTRSVEDWSGGTRIGETLRLFNRLWSRRVLGQGAVVLLITDGLEREGIDVLEREMDRLHRSCRRLVWLNPLLRFEGFEARARGVRAMLPHVDEFRAVHNLEAMADLVAALSGDGTAGTDPRRDTAAG